MIKKSSRETILANPQHDNEMSNDYFRRIANITGNTYKACHTAYQRMRNLGLVGELKNLATNQFANKKSDNSFDNKKTETTKESVLPKHLQALLDRFTQKELEAIANGKMDFPSPITFPDLSFEGKHIKIGLIGDTHLGSSYTNPDYIYQAFEMFKKEGVDLMMHTGDVTEGMSNRPGHIYELSHLGYHEQKKHAIDVLGQFDGESYFIDGNHDRWYIKGSGAIIVKDICDNVKGANFLGHDVGDLKIKGITIQLWHGEDGNSYATSYRIQKIVESISGGNKPNAIFLGHTHKQAHIFERNIQCVSAGCIQFQTPWMRGKRIAAHPGFYIVDLHISPKGITRFKPEWFPFYC